MRKRWQMRAVGFVLGFALVWGAVGIESACHKTTVTNTPPGVSATEVADWYDAVGANQEIARSAKSLTDLAIGLHTTGGVFPDDASYQTTLAALGKLDLIGLQTTDYLRTVPNNWGKPTAQKVGGYVDQLLAQFQIATTSGLDGIKNPDKKAEVDALIQAIRTALQLQISLLNKQGVSVNGKL